jgi:ABC-2 type transport system permease protein
MLGALSVALIPLATGLDAMRQLAFADAAFPAGTPPPLVEVAILFAMTAVSILAARWMLVAMERRARRDGRLSIRWQ